jgi:hypothetical protein
MNPAAPVQPELRRLAERWLLAQLRVRCALRPGEPAQIRQYVHGAELLVRRGARPAIATYQRVLHTLLQAAQDEALPWAWRAMCLEHVDLPLARLTTLLRSAHPALLRTWQQQVEAAREALPVRPDLAC